MRLVRFRAGAAGSFAIAGWLLAACISSPGPPVIESLPTESLRPVSDESLSTLPPTSSSDAQADLVVQVDVTQVIGEINALAGIQGGPLPVVAGDADLTTAYQQAAMHHVRLPQDTLPDNLTLAGTFPSPFAPVANPSSYDFRRLDRYVQAIVDTGATPLWQATYNLGAASDSLTDGETGQQAGSFPTLSEQWGGAIRHTLLHFNDGFADGHAWQVRYVEFINEPFTLGGCFDDAFGVEQCWQRFETFASAINAYNEETGRDVLIVGPAVRVTPDTLDVTLQRLADLLSRLEPDELDYLSFHPQARSPAEYDAIAQALRDFLRTTNNGEFAHVGLWASSWQSVGLDGDTAPALIAARDTAVKILWQNTVDFATLYRADRWPQGPASAADPETGQVDCSEIPVCVDSLYFTPEGEPLPSFMPFFALADMAEQTPQRVAAFNLAQYATPVLAGRSADAGHLSVLIAAPGAEDEAYIIYLTGLPPGVSFEASLFAVDEATHEWIPRETIPLQAGSTGSLRLNGQFFGPSVVYWQLSAASG